MTNVKKLSMLSLYTFPYSLFISVSIYFFIFTYFIRKIRLWCHVFPAHVLCSVYYVFTSCISFIHVFKCNATWDYRRYFFSFSFLASRIFEVVRTVLFLLLLMDSPVLCRRPYSKSVTVLETVGRILNYNTVSALWSMTTNLTLECQYIFFIGGAYTVCIYSCCTWHFYVVLGC